MKYFLKLLLLCFLLFFIKTLIFGKSLFEIRLENNFRFFIDRYLYNKNDIVTQINNICMFDFSEKCKKNIKFSNIGIVGKWDKLYVFPDTLGYGDTGIFLINKKRGFTKSIAFVYEHKGKVVDEGYQSVYFYNTVEQITDFYIENSHDLSKNTTTISYYVCDNLSSIDVVKTELNKQVKPNNCKLMIVSDIDFKKLIKNWQRSKT